MRNRSWGLRLALYAVCVTAISNESCRVAQGDDRPVKSKATVSPAPISPPLEIREFEVRVDNKVRGAHRLTIKLDGNDELAEIQTDVKVDVIVYVYSFKSRGSEVWRDGRLVSSDIRTDDNGKKRAFTLKKDHESDIQLISFNEKSSNTPAQCVMSNAYWRLPHADLRSKLMPMVDADSGKPFQATIVAAGNDSVTAAGRTIACRKFKIDGVSPAELWFDDRDRLVKQASVEQGHHTELRLKQIRTSENEK